MKEVKVIKTGLAGFNGDAWLVKLPKPVEVKSWGDEVLCKTAYFVVSRANAPFTGWEVLVFPANKAGKVLSWMEVAGGRGISHASAINELKEKYAF